MRPPTLRAVTVLGLALAIGLALAAAPFASSDPDGLNRVAERQGFLAAGRATEEAPLRGYAFPGIEHPRVATGLAGFAGTLAVALAAAGVGWAARRRARGPA